MVLTKNKFCHQLLFGILFIAFSLTTQAEEAEQELKIMALFKNAAMVEFNGKQKLYRKGQKLNSKIKLINANSKEATFIIDGKTIKLGLNSSTGFNFSGEGGNTKPSGKKTLKILRNQYGHYVTGGFINGVKVKFLVDTGATTVAMNERVAKLIGLQYRINGIRSRGSTANGIVDTWQVKLKRVRVGSIELQNVAGTVIKGAGPDEVLLGMSYLDRLNMETGGNLLTLSTKF